MTVASNMGSFLSVESAPEYLEQLQELEKSLEQSQNAAGEWNHLK